MQIRLINILILISSLLLCSCDPTVYYDAVLSYRIINNTEERLTFKINYKVDDVFLKTSFELEAHDEELLEVITYDTSNDLEYSHPEKIFSEIYVCRLVDGYLYCDTICDGEKWVLEINDGKEFDEKYASAFELHNFWYDYTFVITDSMLKK